MYEEQQLRPAGQLTQPAVVASWHSTADSEAFITSVPAAIWSWSAGDGRWRDYQRDVSATLEHAYQDYRLSAATAIKDIGVGGGRYVSLELMKQVLGGPPSAPRTIVHSGKLFLQIVPT